MNKLLATAALSALGFLTVGPSFAQEQYLGEVRLVGFNFCPVGWLPANGQILNIQQYTALFALYGTTYGGNGVQNFALPNLQGRAPTGVSTQQPIGAVFGAPSVTLLMGNLPLKIFNCRMFQTIALGPVNTGVVDIQHYSNVSNYITLLRIETSVQTKDARCELSHD
jgi:microcystin-dependent protein